MEWGLVVSSLLPYVAAALPPYKRFVSHLHLKSQCRMKAQVDPRNPEQMRSPGLIVRAHPMFTSSAVISKSPSIGQMNPLGKLGSQSPSIALKNHLGKVLSFPTQVCPLLSVFREKYPPARPTGGPGGSGVDLILNDGLLLNTLTGGYYDIVSWDPRGVGYTTRVLTLLHPLHPVCLLLDSAPA